MNKLDDGRLYYNCFSIPLMGYLKVKRINYLAAKQHHNGKWYYIFEMSPALSEALTEYSNMKKN